jgi:hypothetical protein
MNDDKNNNNNRKYDKKNIISISLSKIGINSDDFNAFFK